MGKDIKWEVRLFRVRSLKSVYYNQIKEEEVYHGGNKLDSNQKKQKESRNYVSKFKGKMYLQNSNSSSKINYESC